MSDDKLKDFIRGHRDDFDGEEPAPNLWNRIDAALDDDEGTDGEDPLKTFVLQNREHFDDTTPPPRLEGFVFRELDGETSTLPARQGQTPTGQAARPKRSKIRRLGWIMGVAASLALLLSAAYLLGAQAGTSATQERMIANVLEQIDPELAETEAYYQREISSQFHRVELVNNDPQLRQDLADIDRATREIRAEILEVPVSQRAHLVNRLIENYRTKLDILLRIQQHLPATVPQGTVPPNQTTDEI